jgi:hypothetical protein
MTPDVMVLGAAMGAICAQPGPFAARRLVARPRWVAVTASSLGLIALGIAWRDAAAWWWVGRPGAPGETAALELRHAAWVKAAGLRPDGRFEARAGEVAAELARGVEPESRAYWQEKALGHKLAAFSRNPHDLYLRLGIAALLDGMGRYEEAAGHYRAVVPLLDLPGQTLRIRFLYGSHCYRRGYALWRSRRPEEGLAWSIEAKRQMELSRKSRGFAPDSPEGKELAGVTAFIRWLEGAQVKPAEGVVEKLELRNEK